MYIKFNLQLYPTWCHVAQPQQSTAQGKAGIIVGD